MGGGNNYGNRLDNRQRGNASQLLEKYRALARDAQQAGDRVTAEYYLQYADHYYRVLGDYRDKQPDNARQRGREFFDDDSSGYAGNGDDSDGGDDEDQDGDRSEARDDRDEQRDDNRGNWRDDRGQGGNQGGQRDGQNRNDRDRNDRSRENAQRDSSQRDNNQRDNNQRDANRDSVAREPGQREPRRDGEGNRDRQNWNGNSPNRSRDSNERPRERAERRPDPVRAAEPAAIDEGPIPGLPGPATLRMPRGGDGERAERAPRAPRREPVVAAAEPVLFEAPPVSKAAEAPEATAPRRRGRPRKIVETAGEE